MVQWWRWMQTRDNGEHAGLLAISSAPTGMSCANLLRRLHGLSFFWLYLNVRYSVSSLVFRSLKVEIAFYSCCKQFVNRSTSRNRSYKLNSWEEIANSFWKVEIFWNIQSTTMKSLFPRLLMKLRNWSWCRIFLLWIVNWLLEKVKRVSKIYSS